MWVNGIEAELLSASDRGVSYGDGVFTTFRLKNGKISHLSLHFDRLMNGCRALSIEGVDWESLSAEIEQSISSASGALHVGKIIITRGSGGRGYSPLGVVNPSRIISLHPYPKHVSKWRSQGIELVLAKFQLGIQPQLAGIKTLNRLEQVLGKQELVERGAVEGVFCDSEGYVVECNASNLFWRKEEKIYTPDLSLSGVEGTMRKQIISFCKEHHSEVNIVRVQPVELDQADEVFICNGVTGPVPVQRFEQKSYQSHFLCRLLQKELDPLHV